MEFNCWESSSRVLSWPFLKKIFIAQHRGVFKAPLSISDGAFCENTYDFLVVNYFRKKLHYRDAW